MKKIIATFFLVLTNWLGFSQNKTMEVRFHEVYELANIVLALTDYGRTSDNEVNKKTTYYRELMSQFGPYLDHTVLKKVNYSLEKWDLYLSFRTDGIAFDFNKDNQLVRNFKFNAMGPRINEFGSNLKMVEDFALKSNFREFYRKKKPFYDSLKSLYEESLMITEITDFLKSEFSERAHSQYEIVVSPLVWRMQCQRPVNGTSTSFINIPSSLYDVKSLKELKKEEVASGLHVFFSEIDHDYVNPTTTKYQKEYKKCFNPEKWDSESGYAQHKFATFNEYMTWAVYDIFVTKYFPDIAPNQIKEWHEVNEKRGFQASSLFGKKLLELYNSKSEGQKIEDLYPALLNWCKEVEDQVAGKKKA